MKKSALGMGFCLAILHTQVGANSPPPPPPPTLELQVRWATHVIIGRVERLAHVLLRSSDGPKDLIGIEFDAPVLGSRPFLIVYVLKTLKTPCPGELGEKFYIDAYSAGEKNYQSIAQVSSTQKLFLIKRSGHVDSDPDVKDPRKYFHFVAPPLDIELTPKAEAILIASSSSNPVSSYCK